MWLSRTCFAHKTCHKVHEYRSKNKWNYCIYGDCSVPESLKNINFPDLSYISQIYTEQKYKCNNFSSYKEISQLKWIHMALVYGFHMTGKTDMYQLFTDNLKKRQGRGFLKRQHLEWLPFASGSATDILRIVSPLAHTTPYTLEVDRLWFFNADTDYWRAKKSRYCWQNTQKYCLNECLRACWCLPSLSQTALSNHRPLVINMVESGNYHFENKTFIILVKYGTVPYFI
jgi:hypothetical protein